MRTSRPSHARARRPVGPTSLAAVLALGFSGAARAQVLPPNPDPTCTVAPADFKSWFPGGPGVDKPVRPADSAALDTSNNCNFYKWSEQMFLWATSPTGLDDAKKEETRVFDSPVFYQVDGDRLVQRHGGPLEHLFLRAAKSGPDGLPIVIDSEGRLREFVAASRGTEPAARDAVGGARPAEIASVKAGRDGKAVFLNAQGKPVEGPKPVVTPDMLPPSLGRLNALAAPANQNAALAEADVRRTVAQALTDEHVLIKVDTPSGPAFVEAGTGTVQSLAPGQAGGNGVLLSQQGSVVFYETLVNDVYNWYLTGRTTPNGIPPYYKEKEISTYGYFPTTTVDLNAILDFTRSHGGPTTLPDAQALAMEIKLAWVDVRALPDGAQGYITARATVPDYDRSDPRAWAPKKPQEVTVALVGAHIVGSTAGHPEMIWATFEHQRNTPLAQYSYRSKGALQPTTVPQNTSGRWLFSASGASKEFNAEKVKYCPPSPPNKPVTDTQDACYQKPGDIVAKEGVPAIVPSDILREKAWGVASDHAPNPEDKDAAASNTEIISLDTDVQAQLAAAGAGADPRFNYLLIGATWTLDGGEPTCSWAFDKCHLKLKDPKGVQPPPNQIGTSMLENSTMETFHQGSATTASGDTLNCPDCHNTKGHDPKKKADTYVSHIFQGLAATLERDPQNGAK